MCRTLPETLYVSLNDAGALAIEWKAGQGDEEDVWVSGRVEVVASMVRDEATDEKSYSLSRNTFRPAHEDLELLPDDATSSELGGYEDVDDEDRFAGRFGEQYLEQDINEDGNAHSCDWTDRGAGDLPLRPSHLSPWSAGPRS